MPRKRNLLANKSNKNRYGEPLFGAVTPRKLTPKRTTPMRFTRAKYTPAKIPPNTAQKPRPKVKLHKPPAGYSFLSQKQWKEFRLTEKRKKENTEANIKENELPEVKDPKQKKKTKNI